MLSFGGGEGGSCVRGVCPPGQQSGGGRGNRVAAPEGHHITVFLHRLPGRQLCMKAEDEGTGWRRDARRLCGLKIGT